MVLEQWEDVPSASTLPSPPCPVPTQDRGGARSDSRPTIRLVDHKADNIG